MYYEKKITSSSKKTKHDPNKCVNCEDGENTDEEPDSGVPNDLSEVFGGVSEKDENRMDAMIFGNQYDIKRNKSMVVRTMQKEEYKAEKNIKSS